MWCGTLQFEYDEHDTLVAKNMSKTVPVDKVFDFHSYRLSTNTRPCPLVFQTLVQNAIAFSIHQRKHGTFREQFWKRVFPIWDLFPRDLNTLMLDYLGECAIEGFGTCLLPHQIDAVEFLSTRKAALLAAATGLGKTAVSLGFAMLHRLKRILIVCPPTLQTNWENEIARFILGVQDATPFFMFDEEAEHAKKRKRKTIQPQLPPDNCPLLIHIDHGVDASRMLAKLSQISPMRVCFVLLRYNLLNPLCTILLQQRQINWEALVFDEGHALKCSKSQRSKAAFQIVNTIQPKHTILLSATPSPSTKDWWHLLHIMDPVLFDKFFHYKPADRVYPACEKTFFFAERYVATRPMRSGDGSMHWNFDTSTRMQELHAITRPYVMCQTKDMLNLPPFLREYVVVGEATKQQQKQFATRIQTIVAKDGSLAEMQASFQQLVQQASIDKMPLVLHYIQDMLENDSERFIVWVHFKETMKTIAKHFIDNNVRFIRINGDTPSLERDVSLDMFAKDTTIRIALLSIDTCGTGLNMTFVHTSVYAELTYNHVAQIQSEGRCHRIGQRAKCVTALYLIVKHSPDEMIWNSMLRKADIESLVLTNKKADFDYQTQDIKHDLKQYLAQMQEQRPDVWKCTSKPTTQTNDDTIINKLAKRRKQLD